MARRLHSLLLRLAMKLTFRKREVKDVSELESLVVENSEALEAGFRIVAANINLGRSSVSLAGLDSATRPVLVSVGLQADDAMIFRMVEAYAWCLEYPDSLQCLMPARRGLGDWPPRVVFIAERMVESFLRKIRLLRFPRVDCLEYRYVEVNGAIGFYLDPVEWRRDTPAAPTLPDEDRAPTLRTPALEACPPREAPVASPLIDAADVAEDSVSDGDATVTDAPESTPTESPQTPQPELSDVGAARELTPTWRRFLDKLTGGFEPRPVPHGTEPPLPLHQGATGESEPPFSPDFAGSGVVRSDPDDIAALASPEAGAAAPAHGDRASQVEDEYYDKQRQLLEGLKLPSNGELAPQWRKFLDEPPTPDERKSAVIREYLQREFPMSVVYGFHDFQRNALVFQLQDNQGKVMQLATMTAEFLDDCRESEIRAWIESHRLAQALRQAGQAGVLVTRAGLLIDHR